ncbi:SusE outer membrane protein [Saccharicrinis carchari]|uniref:SusE outer membrane protein n=2 Tax=Saccharicrinis carchari TaxID=1168039 RepID=A0A521F5A3_SACCC|nr:SusE outer membrane protein [Saccharicrinis carchari]
MYKSIIYGFSMLLALSSCEEVNMLQLGETVDLVLSSDVVGKSIVLSEDIAEEPFGAFTWTPADFGYPSASPEYILQMDFEGNDFKNAITLINTLDLRFENTNAMFNQKLITLGAVPGVASNLEFKLTGKLHEEVYAVGNVLTANITPYKIVPVFPKLYVTGDHNTWGFNDESAIFSVKDNAIYEGYIYLREDGLIKFSQQPNWDNPNAIIGDLDESGTSGVLQIGNWGGNNIVASQAAGVYKFMVNLNNQSYSQLLVNWAVTGDFNSWAMADMVYDITTGLWSLTVDMTAGGFKFIANQDWGKVYGDDEMDGVLDKGSDGNNIIIQEGGNYTITMDLSDALYTYSIVKNN